MDNIVKACWWCKHFNYTQSEAGYSDYTPGTDFHIACNKDKWVFDPEYTTQDEFGKILQTASICQDFEVIPPKSPHVPDKVISDGMSPMVTIKIMELKQEIEELKNRIDRL